MAGRSMEAAVIGFKFGGFTGFNPAAEGGATSTGGFRTFHDLDFDGAGGMANVSVLCAVAERDGPASLEVDANVFLKSARLGSVPGFCCGRCLLGAKPSRRGRLTGRVSFSAGVSWAKM